MIGEKLKELREAQGMLQRQVAAELDVDTAYISKMENNEKPVSRTHIKKLSHLYNVPSEELLTIWLANKILKTIENEKYKQEALKLALKTIK